MAEIANRKSQIANPPDVLIGLSLTVLAIVFFWPAAVGRGTFYFFDTENQNYPLRDYYARHVREGVFPLWCPELLAGYPLFAEGQAGAAYPGNLLFLLPWPTWWAFSWTVILHLALAGWGMYGFLRALRAAPAGAAAGAAAFMFSGFLVCRVQHVNMMNSAAWIPTLFWLVERGCQTRRAGWFLADGAALGCQLLAGHAQITVYTLAVLGPYLLFRAKGTRDKGQGTRDKGQGTRDKGTKSQIANHKSQIANRIFLPALLLLGTAAAFAAVQLVPTAELITMSERAGGLSYERSRVYPLESWHLLFFFVPNVCGRRFAEGYWGPLLYWEYVAYLGLLPLLLAGLSPWLVERRTAWFWWIVAAVFGLGAFGDHLPVYRLLWHLPGFHSMRGPARLLVIWTFATCVLAGLSLSALAEGGTAQRPFPTGPKPPGRWALRHLSSLIPHPSSLIRWSLCVVWSVWGLGVLFAATQFWPTLAAMEPQRARTISASILALLFFSASALTVLTLLIRGVRGAGWAAAGLVIVDLGWAFWGYHPFQPPSYWTERTPDRVWVERETGPFRLLAPAARQLRADTNLLYGFSNFWMMTPLWTQRHQIFYRHCEEDRFHHPERFERLLDLLQVRFIQRPPPEAKVPLPEVPKVSKVPGERNELHGLVRRTERLPRAWIVPCAHFVANGNEAFAAATDPQRDLRAEVVVEGRGDGRERKGTEGNGRGRKGTKGTRKRESEDPATHVSRFTFHVSRLVLYEPHRVRAEVTARDRGWFVLGDSFYPGWRVYVDGRERAVYRANYLFRAVPLIANDRTVDWVYQPTGFRLGFFVSGLALGGLVGWWVGGLARTSGTRRRETRRCKGGKKP
jgi:hypothetical protein